jgi:hypothetical protein
MSYVQNENKERKITLCSACLSLKGKTKKIQAAGKLMSTNATFVMGPVAELAGARRVVCWTVQAAGCREPDVGV